MDAEGVYDASSANIRRSDDRVDLNSGSLGIRLPEHLGQFALRARTRENGVRSGQVVYSALLISRTSR